jgi:hypothetical protein
LHRTKFALADAQLIVARAHRFDSWPTFAEHIETITGESSSRMSIGNINCAQLAEILDLFGEDRWRRVYAGESKVRPPGAPTIGRD